MARVVVPRVVMTTSLVVPPIVVVPTVVVTDVVPRVPASTESASGQGIGTARLIRSLGEVHGGRSHKERHQDDSKNDAG